jgi:hypothetical protein
VVAVESGYIGGQQISKRMKPCVAVGLVTQKRSATFDPSSSAIANLPSVVCHQSHDPQPAGMMPAHNRSAIYHTPERSGAEEVITSRDEEKLYQSDLTSLLRDWYEMSLSSGIFCGNPFQGCCTAVVGRSGQDFASNLLRS